jgi:hypothetical protein
MINSNSILGTCFTMDLLIYSYKFIKTYDFVFLNISISNSVSFVWCSKVSYLIRTQIYSYEKYKKIYLSKNRRIFRSYSNLHFKIIELAFCFLIVSFFKVFSPEILSGWVYLVVKYFSCLSYI